MKMTKDQVKRTMVALLKKHLGVQGVTDAHVDRVWDAYRWCAKENDPLYHTPRGIPQVGLVDSDDWGRSFFFRVRYPDYAVACLEAYRYALRHDGVLFFNQPTDM